ncbi:hypothetical protein ACIQXW_11330 [Lysinibacillus sp. NPDC097162]|uniref:hypothetical protein n=1 Tax=Lysinibacillus sp. NPDC097162 TaxID=3364140 RepID=UPI0038299E5B
MKATNNINQDNLQQEKIKRALAKYGIYNEEQLNLAIREMKPLNIGCMVSPVPSKKAIIQNAI